MLKQASDPAVLQAYVERLRDNLDAPQLQEPASQAASVIYGDGDPVTKLRRQIPDVQPGLESSVGTGANVPFLSRDPIQSLLQSSITSKMREHGVGDELGEDPSLLARIIRRIKSLLHPVRFGPDDPGWLIDVGGAMLDRLGRGNHPFNPNPASHQIADDARIVVVGDWGTGLPRAKAVASFMAEEVADALANGREAHVVHLGDIYYSGLPDEVDHHVLGPGLWPVTLEQARAGVTSWSLNGNHDMYGGGYGYFERLLVDERFSAQRCGDGHPTSFFVLTSPHWKFLGLDTSWDPNVLSQGQKGVLEEPQAGFVEGEAQASPHKLMLLSHHQLISVYDAQKDIGTILPAKLGPVLDSGRVTAWLWGHEHRCMGFVADHGIKFPRCIGHGGVPVLMEHQPGDPIPPPGEWEQREFEEYEGERWARFGFAVLDLEADRIKVRYRDERGVCIRREEFA